MRQRGARFLPEAGFRVLRRAAAGLGLRERGRPATTSSYDVLSSDSSSLRSSASPSSCAWTDMFLAMYDSGSFDQLRKLLWRI